MRSSHYICTWKDSFNQRKGISLSLSRETRRVLRKICYISWENEKQPQKHRRATQDSIFNPWRYRMCIEVLGRKTRRTVSWVSIWTECVCSTFGHYNNVFLSSFLFCLFLLLKKINRSFQSRLASQRILGVCKRQRKNIVAEDKGGFCG